MNTHQSSAYRTNLTFGRPCAIAPLSCTAVLSLTMQEPVQLVQDYIGKQGGYHPALWYALLGGMDNSIDAHACLQQATDEIEELWSITFSRKQLRMALCEISSKHAFTSPSMTQVNPCASVVDSERSHDACFDWAETHKNCHGTPPRRLVQGPCEWPLARSCPAGKGCPMARSLPLALGIITRLSG